MSLNGRRLERLYQSSIVLAFCVAALSANAQTKAVAAGTHVDSADLVRTMAWLERDAPALLSSRILNPSAPAAFSARHISKITVLKCQVQWTSTDTIVTAAGKQYDDETLYRLPIGKVNVRGIVVTQLAPGPTRNLPDILVRLPARPTEGKIVERWVKATAQPLIDLASLPVHSEADGERVATALILVAVSCGAPLN